jgi:PKD repeat protein
MIALLVALLFSGLLSTAASADTTDPLPLPATMAAVGDSISQAASSAGSLGADAPQNSWSTGTSTTVNSHYLRLLALGAPISGENHNLSVSGSKAADLNAQMLNMVALGPDFLTAQIGGNDLCTDTFAGMTSVSTFRAQIEAAMLTLKNGAPGTRVYLTSIPDAYQLWSLFRNDFWARFIWSVGGVCQSLLANPTSTQQADVDRRAAVRQRNIDYNTQLAQVCATYPMCRFDNNAVFNTQFTTSDVAGDYFHPSIAGQAKLAAGTWAVGYTWATAPVPNVAPTARFTSSCVDLTCTFTDMSTDSDGTIASRSWTFGDGGTSTAAGLTHSYAVEGTYTVGLTVTDDGGAAASASAQVAVTAPPPEPMWIGSLGSATTTARNTWTARVTITVAGGSGATPAAVSDVVVTGSWSAGSGGTSCTTGATGACMVTSSSLSKKNVASVRFTVSGLAWTGWVYDPAKNAGGTNSITVLRP